MKLADCVSHINANNKEINSKLNVSVVFIFVLGSSLNTYIYYAHATIQ